MIWLGCIAALAMAFLLNPPIPPRGETIEIDGMAGDSAASRPAP